MSNMPVGVLRDIASELKMIRKVLERMVQAPMFNKTEVAYICDTKACDECTNDDCMRTTNIEHACNFEQKDGKYFEVSRSLPSQ